MKILSFFLLILSLCTPAHAQPRQIRSLDWLIGTWERTNNKPGYMTIETWQRDGDAALKGTGVMMKGMDTVFVEKLRLIVKDDVLNYVADVPENKGLVYFPFTSQGKSSFICENAAHDFPKKLSYELKGNELTAIVSCGKKSITYLFKKR